MWQTFQAYLRLGGLTALWILLVWTLARWQPDRLRIRLKSREAAAFAFLMLALVTAGVSTNLRHLHGLFTNYASRLLVRPGSIIATEPAVAGDKVLFTTMVPSGYAIASLDRGLVTCIAGGADALYPAVSEWGEGWVELASRCSRIVRSPLRGLPFEPDQMSIEAEDAEQPAVSLDARWLAFIREKRGRGSLWTKELWVKTDSAPACAAESMVVGNEYGVLEAAFFPDDRIIFAAELGKSAGLFVLDMKTRRVSPVSVSSRPTRYPAVSPDGQWLAYSREEMGDWQLWVMRISTGAKPRLTGGDCNSTTPAWFGDSRTLAYATDCGRGLGLTALCRVQAVP